jgi:hypothetical protein
MASTSVFIPVPRRAHVHVDPELARARRMAHLLDRYHLDPILGLLVPFAGDVAGALLGLYTVAIAVRRRISSVIVARMLLNLGLDAVLGVVPLLGDLADFGFRANLRNVALLESRIERGGRATAKDWFVVIGAALVFVAALGLLVYLFVALVQSLRSVL